MQCFLNIRLQTMYESCCDSFISYRISTRDKAFTLSYCLNLNFYENNFEISVTANIDKTIMKRKPNFTKLSFC